MCVLVKECGAAAHKLTLLTHWSFCFTNVMTGCSTASEINVQIPIFF